MKKGYHITQNRFPRHRHFLQREQKSCDELTLRKNYRYHVAPTVKDARRFRKYYSNFGHFPPLRKKIAISQGERRYITIQIASVRNTNTSLESICYARRICLASKNSQLESPHEPHNFLTPLKLQKSPALETIIPKTFADGE